MQQKMATNVVHMNQRGPDNLISIFTTANQRGAVSFPVVFRHQRLQKRVHERVVDTEANAGLLNQQLAERSVVSDGPTQINSVIVIVVLLKEETIIGSVGTYRNVFWRRRPPTRCWPYAIAGVA